MAQNLFYSEDEKILFWIAGYIHADNTQDLNDLILSLQENEKEFIAMGGKGVIKTDYVHKSRRYKYMRYFFCEEFEPENVPEDVFRITGENGWTMYKWIED